MKCVKINVLKEALLYIADPKSQSYVLYVNMYYMLEKFYLNEVRKYVSRWLQGIFFV